MWNQNSFPCLQICNTVTWEQFSWSIERYACWYIRKQVQHDWSIVETYLSALNLFKECVTWVTTFTAFVCGVFSSNQPVLLVLQVLQASFSISSHQINQCYECYKRYNLHFLSTLIKSTTVTSVTTLMFSVFSTSIQVSQTSQLLSTSIRMLQSLQVLQPSFKIENKDCNTCNAGWFDERICNTCNTCTTGWFEGRKENLRIIQVCNTCNTCNTLL